MSEPTAARLLRRATALPGGPVVVQVSPRGGIVAYHRGLNDISYYNVNTYTGQEETTYGPSAQDTPKHGNIREN